MAETSADAQIPVRSHGDKRCSNHWKDLVYFCETCTGLVCGKCVTTDHKGHEFAGIETVVQSAKEKIQIFVNQIENIDIPLISKEMENVETELEKNTEHYQSEIRLIREKNEIIKEELDYITGMMVLKCQDMGAVSSYTLSNHLAELSELKQEMTSHLRDYKDYFLSDDDVLVYDVSNAVPNVSTHLPKPICEKVSFTQGKCSLKILEDMIGELIVFCDNQTLKQLEQSDRKKAPSRFSKVGDLFKTGKRTQQTEQEQVLVQVQPKFQAAQDYKATEDNQIGFRKDDIINDVFIINKDWMEGTVTRTRMSGRFPRSSVERIPIKVTLDSQSEACRSSVMCESDEDKTEEDGVDSESCIKSMFSTISESEETEGNDDNLQAADS